MAGVRAAFPDLRFRIKGSGVFERVWVEGQNRAVFGAVLIEARNAVQVRSRQGLPRVTVPAARAR